MALLLDLRDNQAYDTLPCVSQSSPIAVKLHLQHAQHCPRTESFISTQYSIPLHQFRCTGHAKTMLMANQSVVKNAQDQEGATRVLASLAHNNTNPLSLLHYSPLLLLAHVPSTRKSFHLAFTACCRAKKRANRAHLHLLPPQLSSSSPTTPHSFSLVGSTLVPIDHTHYKTHLALRAFDHFRNMNTVRTLTLAAVAGRYLPFLSPCLPHNNIISPPRAANT